MTETHAMERLEQMSREEVDDLPYGFIVLDGEGTVLLYNRYEARMSRVPPERVLGRNFFREIAPCTRVDAFFGRFQALAEAPPGSTERFAFRFHFLHGAQDVLIQLCRAPADRVFMTVHRRHVAPGDDGVDSVEHEKAERSRELRLDADRGRLCGPLGPALPLGEEQMAAVLLRLGSRAARDLGRSLGRAVARAAEAASADAGEPRLEAAPPQLAVGALDEAMARAGLGRIAVDLTAHPARLLCFARPSLGASLVELSALYEGILEAALGAALGAPYAARCVEGLALAARPWRFALAPSAETDALEPRAGEQPEEVLERLGLGHGNGGAHPGKPQQRASS